MGFSWFGRRFNKRSGDPVGTLQDTLSRMRRASFFSPTPFAVARQMLELAQTSAQDIVYDLGSGDGRIPIMAAQEFKCHAVGIDLDEKLCRHSQEKVKEYGLEGSVTFRSEDFFKADLRAATVVTLYLLPQVNGHLAPRLASQLRNGARVVSLDYEVPGWRAEQSRVVKSEGDVEYTLYLYKR